jgi:hypothetical protein
MPGGGGDGDAVVTGMFLLCLGGARGLWKDAHNV